MKLYEVRSGGKDEPFCAAQVSSGFSSRAAAERFAAGLSAAGKCSWAKINSYEVDDEDDDD